MKKMFVGLFILSGFLIAPPVLAETTTSSQTAPTVELTSASDSTPASWKLSRLDTGAVLEDKTTFEPGKVLQLTYTVNQAEDTLQLLDPPAGVSLSKLEATAENPHRVSLTISPELTTEFPLIFALGNQTKSVLFQPATTTEQSKPTVLAESETATTLSTAETKNQSSESTESTTTQSTKNSQSEAATLTASDGNLPVAVDEIVTPEQLLQLVTYTGDKSQLKVKITDTKYVYVTPDAEVYHYDLNGLLPKTKIERVSVLTEQQAKDLGRRLATEVSDKTINKINRSLAGQYNVSFSDATQSAQCTVTIGDPIAASQAGLQKLKNTQVTTTSTTNNSSTTNSSSPSATPISFATPSSAAAPATSGKTIPPFGEKPNIYSGLGFMLFMLASLFLFKAVRNQAKN